MSDVLDDSFNGIQLVNHNVQGLHSKMDKLSVWLQTSDGKDVIYCFSETYIKPNDPPLKVPGFQVFLSPVQVLSRSRSKGFLPGSMIIVSNNFEVDHSDICRYIGESS